ncbi:MAG: hypothetical protein ACRDD1_08905, partial [Planctomycetia bacterium]
MELLFAPETFATAFAFCCLAAVTSGGFASAVFYTAVYALLFAVLLPWGLSGVVDPLFVQAGLAAAALIPAALTALRWPETPWLEDGFWSWARRRWIERGAALSVPDDVRGDRGRSIAVRVLGDGLFARLVWREVFAARYLLAVGAVGWSLVPFLLASLQTAADPAVKQSFRLFQPDDWIVFGFLGAASFWACVCGAAAFAEAEDAVGDGGPHWSQRGLSPTMLWAAKLAVWLPAAYFSAIAWAFAPTWFKADLIWTPFVTNAVYTLGVAGLVALGGSGGLLPRRPKFAASSLIAIGSGLTFGPYYLFGVGLIIEWGAPWWWTAALAPLLLAALRLDVGAWLQGKEGWARSRPAMLLLAPGLLALGGAAVYHRATAVPAVPSAAAAYAAWSTPPSAAAVETANLYRDAVAQHRTFDSFHVPVDGENEAPPEEPLAPRVLAARRAQEAAYVAANQEVVVKTLAATRRPTCVFIDRSTAMKWDEPVDDDALRDLGRLLVADALRLQRAGDLDGAAERYMAMFRMARHVAEGRPLDGWTAGWAIDAVARSRLYDWAWRDGQTPERIHAMTVLLESSDGLLDMVVPALETEGLIDRRKFTTDVPPPETVRRWVDQLRGYLRLFPWVGQRWHRLHDQLAARRLAAALTDVRRLAAAVPAPDRSLLHLPPDAPPSVGPTATDVERWRRTTMYFRLWPFFDDDDDDERVRRDV